MDGNSHYIRIDANNIVIHRFSDAFEQPQPGDICVASDAGRHYNDPITNADGYYIYKWDGSNIVDRTNDADYLLTIAKANKLAELDSKYNQATSFIQSSALGTPHTYVVRNGGADYSNFFNSQFQFILSAYYDGNPFMWYTIEDGDISHTKDQFAQVYTDIHNFTQTARTNRKTYQNNIGACTTVDAVNAITITF